MKTQTHNEVLAQAVTRLLKPLIKILLRNGIAYGTFAELSRKAYVEVAFEDDTGSKKPTISSVSARTGLTRKETKRLLELDSVDAQSSDQRYNRAVRVIGGWLNDTRFQDEDGQPKALVTEGDEQSFAQLIKTYSGDIPAQAMLDVLTKAGCVERQDARLVLVKRAFIPSDDDLDKLNILGVDVGELISTIDHNLRYSQQDSFFQRKVSNHRLDPVALNQFKALSAEKSQQLLEELDHWLSEHEVNGEQQGFYVGLGIHYIEHSR